MRKSNIIELSRRKTRSLEAALSWLYLKGISTGETGATLEVLVGPKAKGMFGQHSVSFEAGLGTRIPELAIGDGVGTGRSISKDTATTLLGTQDSKHFEQAT